MAWFGKRDAEAETLADPELEPAAEAGATAVESFDSEPVASESEVSAPADPTPVVSAPVISAPVISTPVASRSVVFQPVPLGDDDGAEAEGAVAFVPSAATPSSAVPEPPWTMPMRPAPTAAAPRTPLQEQMAEIAEKHKDGPIEDMTAPIRAALAAHGRDVPDDWILAIAQGLRQHGPIPPNLGGPGPAPKAGGIH